MDREQKKVYKIHTYNSSEANQELKHQQHRNLGINALTLTKGSTVEKRNYVV